MSRATRSSTRLKEELPQPISKKPKDDFPSAELRVIDESIHHFVESVSYVQVQINEEVVSMTEGMNSLLTVMGNRKKELHELTSFISAINNKHKSLEILQKADENWRLLMREKEKIMGRSMKKRRELGSIGRNVAASLIITGNVYSGLAVLQDVIDISENDAICSLILLRWLVRYNEWEAMDSLLQNDSKKKKSDFVDQEEFVEICKSINEFHRSPRGREEKAVKLMQKAEEMNSQADKTFGMFENQILLNGALANVSKVAGISTSKMVDPLYCIELAYLKSEVVAKSRYPSFWCDKDMEPINSLMKKPYDYLRTASAIAEYYDMMRIVVNEYVRCSILREPTQYSSIGLCNAIRLSLPFWFTQSLSLVIGVRSKSQADPDDLLYYKNIAPAYFMKEEPPQKKSKEDTCVTQMTEKMHKISPFSDDLLIHLPTLSTSSFCKCFLCLEYSFNPSFSFICSQFAIVYGEWSISSISSFLSNFTRIRTLFAPLQIKLINASDGGKPRPPMMAVDEVCNSVIRFLLSPIGMNMSKKDSQRMKMIETTMKMCSYSNQVCLPYRLILRLLSRKQRVTPTYPWMTRKSIMSKLGDFSIGSEGKGRRTPTRSPFTPISFNTPNGRKGTGKMEESGRDEEEERKDYKEYAHLLYHDWRSRLCEELAIESDDAWMKVMYLSEIVAVSTRQARRISTGRVTPFGFTRVDEFKSAISIIPPDMTVNELVVSMSGDLYLMKLHSQRTPIVIPLARENKWMTMLEGFMKAMMKSDETAQAGKNMTDGKKYWEGRRKAEEMMKKAMMDMESDLLGAFSPLLLPSRKLTKIGESVATSIRMTGDGSIKRDLAREMVAIAAQTNTTQFKSLVECMSELEGWNWKQKEELIGLKKGSEENECTNWIEETKELPFVFFVISTELSRIPWEAISILEKKCHSSRLVSIHQLLNLLTSFTKVPYTANPLSAFYILDPGNDLAATKERLTPVVEKFPWKGVTGKGPEREEALHILRDNDFFIFLGHGNGLRYLSRSGIRKNRCKAVVLLMGCSSVHTTHEGRGMDGKGAVLDYSVASCPCIVGCIYMVTDGEIDKYFTALVDGFIGEDMKNEGEKKMHVIDSSPSRDLRLHLEAMARARRMVKLPYLTGSTVVSYGIPIDMQVTSSSV